MSAYYNEIDLYAAEWLRNLIKAGHIADGEVDTRSIINVSPDDIRHFTQCHFFAGIAGWSHALRLAGWADDRKIWTGSCPCQPFSVAGKGKGTDDERHLWPHFFRLIRGCRPPVVMGEQVAGAAGYGWLDGIRSDMESESYTIEGVDIPACSVNAPHIRQRLYWVASDMANTLHERLEGHGRLDECVKQRNGSKYTTAPSIQDMADAKGEQLRGGHAEEPVSTSSSDEGEAQQRERIWSDAGADGNYFWNNAVWLNGADGKARRSKSGVCLLAHGVPARVGKLRAYGNAIVPQVAAEVIRAFMENKDFQ
jgi:DNA (cytosine-5)-methyltransferase 1